MYHLTKHLAGAADTVDVTADVRICREIPAGPGVRTEDYRMTCADCLRRALFAFSGDLPFRKILRLPCERK